VWKRDAGKQASHRDGFAIQGLGDWEMDQGKGFFGELFDFSFSEFITTRIIKVLFVLAVIGSVIYGLVVLGQGVVMLRESVALGLGMIVVSPIVFLLCVIAARVYLELIMIIFRIAEDTEEIAGRGRTTAGPEPPAPGV
jgi:uncharacterized membrane protein